jgi:adenosylcobyric acid synthase
LEWLRQTGLAKAVAQFARSGGAVVGICGGYQMFGERIDDLQHIESRLDSLAGLGLLPVTTRFLQEKATFQVQARFQSKHGWLAQLNGTLVSGYEIHMGETPSQSPWLEITRRNGEQVNLPDGCVSPNGKIWGCYLHGIFANDTFRQAWLESLGWQRREQVSTQAEVFDQSLEALADAVESALSMEMLEKIIWEN